jgi:hypothetical protein
MEGINNGDTFWATFTGEYVEILAKFVGGEGVPMPLTIQGFLLDRDDEYYYIGEGPIEINCCVKRSDVIFISILDPEGKEKDALKEILEDMPVPEDEVDVN